MREVYLYYDGLSGDVIGISKVKNPMHEANPWIKILLNQAQEIKTGNPSDFVVNMADVDNLVLEKRDSKRQTIFNFTPRVKEVNEQLPRIKNADIRIDQNELIVTLKEPVDERIYITKKDDPSVMTECIDLSTYRVGEEFITVFPYEISIYKDN